MTTFTPEIQTALAAEFEDNEVGWKPQVTTKGKNKEPITRNGVQVAGCTAHIDARAVMNRLDAVVGVGGWSDAYTVLNAKNVECTLTVFGVSKSDVGETNDGGFADAMKSAYSDALKRAAVKFGIGRYLYDMEMEWLPYDGYKITSLPAPKKQAPPKQAPVNRQPAPLPPVKPVPPGVNAETGEVLPPDAALSPEPGTPDQWALWRGRVQSNPKSTVKTVCNAVGNTGLYSGGESHAINAAATLGLNDPARKLTQIEALDLFDLLVARKVDAPSGQLDHELEERIMDFGDK